MRGRSLVQADKHHDPLYQKHHQDRAAMCDTLQEALMAGLSKDEMAELVHFSNGKESE